jgi:hypothetical protein
MGFENSSLTECFVFRSFSKICLFLNYIPDLINVYWRTGHMCEEWYIAVVVPMYKKGSEEDSNNC